MWIVADTHVHLYPVHDVDRWLDAAFQNLKMARAAERVVCLTERFDCHAFRDNIFRGDRIGESALRVERAGEPLFVLAGRQVVTSERLEVLAIGADAEIPDGRPLSEALARVREAGGVPVLAWAPGKWFFQRGKIIAGVLEREPPGSLLIGDSSLRPTLWPDPDLMSYGHARGFKIVAGSDPLPIAGDEALVGTYGSAWDASFDPARPGASIRAALLDPVVVCHTRGRRGAVMDVVRRLRRHRAAG